MIKIFTDGGSRGNPGESASACVFKNTQDEIIWEEARCLGIKTNNEAEYDGVLLALHNLETQFPAEKKVAFYLDSKLVVEQLSGRWKIKDAKIKILVAACQKQIQLLGLDITFTHIPRSQNALADALVNQALDS